MLTGNSVCFGRRRSPAATLQIQPRKCGWRGATAHFCERPNTRSRAGRLHVVTKRRNMLHLVIEGATDIRELRPQSAFHHFPKYNRSKKSNDSELFSTWVPHTLRLEQVVPGTAGRINFRHKSRVPECRSGAWINTSGRLTAKTRALALQTAAKTL